MGATTNLADFNSLKDPNGTRHGLTFKKWLGNVEKLPEGFVFWPRAFVNWFAGSSLEWATYMFDLDTNPEICPKKGKTRS